MKKIQLELPDETNLVLKALAAADGRSLNKEITYILKCYALGLFKVNYKPGGYVPSVLSGDEVASIATTILERGKKQNDEKSDI